MLSLHAYQETSIKKHYRFDPPSRELELGTQWHYGIVEKILGGRN